MAYSSEGWFKNNNFASWISAPEDEDFPVSEESFIDSMKAGRLYMGDPVYLKDSIEFTADGCEMGSVFYNTFIHNESIAEIDGNDQYFKVCIDTGHVNSVRKFENHSVGDFIREFGKNVVCLHMHDNDGFSDQHLPLYSGTVDWNDVFDALDSVGFDGIYNLEIDLNRYGKGFEPDAAEFVVKLLRFALNKRYSRTNG